MEEIRLWDWIRQNVHMQAPAQATQPEQCPFRAALGSREVENKARFEWALHEGAERFLDYGWIVKRR